MRVVAGTAGGHPLKAPRGGATRPTADRNKEALFSMIEALLARAMEVEMGTPELWRGIRVLDLYAGSGALGIEALSRGAEHATFVEAQPAAAAVIRENLRATGLVDRATIRLREVARVFDGLRDPVQLVLMDPPYADPAALSVLQRVAAASWLAADALIAFEHAPRLACPDKLGTLTRQRERRHGDTMLTLYARGRLKREDA